ncbi:hypothetical protein LX81_00281 [Palleronia aestuarii]|uniref:Uncharacterized protein n=1 Tax=Palleronia aestuarii TaxID=568105 RepID=A0A2W7NHT2_9RHOB|nr:hypothetical protein [Palleronia aestuarii]PZX19818.1 hypothetical protein LX81_00281 [Palleronia aestuarii]
MKIIMKKDDYHRISSALSQSFKAGEEYDLPQGTANALIERGSAAAASKNTSSEKDA